MRIISFNYHADFISSSHPRPRRRSLGRSVTFNDRHRGLYCVRIESQSLPPRYATADLEMPNGNRQAINRDTSRRTLGRRGRVYPCIPHMHCVEPRVVRTIWNFKDAINRNRKPVLSLANIYLIEPRLSSSYFCSGFVDIRKIRLSNTRELKITRKSLK